MKLQMNFKSFVAIGRFNPSILSPDFLSEYCSFESDHDPVGRNTPVITEIKFGDYQFLMELDKFQILVSNIADFSDDDPIDVMIRYLEVLEHTPIQLFGVNFNYSLLDVDVTSIMRIAMEPCNISGRLKINPDLIAMRAMRSSEDSLAANELTVNHYLESGVKNTIRLVVEDNALGVNSNYEIGDLSEDRRRIGKLKENYPRFVEHNQGLVRLLECMSNDD